MNIIYSIRSPVRVDDNITDNIEILWKEPAIKEIFSYRAKLSIDDSSSYLFDQVRQITTRSYIPTYQV